MQVEGLNDSCRLNALGEYDVLDTPQEEAFDRITRLARRIFDVEFATVTFLDGHRQWFKSRQGLSVVETPRHVAFCQIPVIERAPLVVPDTLADCRFCDNPLVQGAPHLRFYAGVPLQTRAGHVLGTICAMDTRPRVFSQEQLNVLCDLAKLVATTFRALARSSREATNRWM